MTALLVTADLMATSAADGAAMAAGVELRTISPAAAIESASEQTRLIAIDLGAPISDLGSFVADLRDATTSATLIAYGPHVHEAKLQAAQQAGCDLVLSRGQFYKQFADLLRRYATDASSSE